MNSKIFSLVVFFAIFLTIATIPNALGENSQKLQIEVKYTNGDRIDAYQTNYKIYQDSEKTPFLEKELITNPETIDLPQDHRYKVEVYVNGIFSEVGYVELDDSSEKLEIKIPLPGGLKFNVFFADGQTPINDATVIIRSQDGKEQRVGKTDDLGQTMRYWLQSTTLKENFYIAEVYFDDFLLTKVSNIKIHQGIAQEQKITVPIPPTIEDLITFNLFDTDSNKILRNNGDYSVMLSGKNNLEFIESLSGPKGEIYFSNIPSGVYSVSVLRDDVKDTLWKDKDIIITGNQTQFSLSQTNPIMPSFSGNGTEKDADDIVIIDSVNDTKIKTSGKPIIYQPSVEKFTITCQCVSFRLDDVQDYWLNDVQMELINLFAHNKIPLTVGIIANSFGEDPAITELVKNKLSKKEIIVANHGVDSTPFTLFDKSKQASMLNDSSNKIFEKLHVHSKIFIPPQNRFNEDTKNVLIENGYTHLSASMLSDSAPFPLKNQKLYRFPELATTGEYVPSQNRILGVSSEKTFSNAKDAIDKFGFAVITIHPQEFSVFQGGEYQNQVNSIQMDELQSLIDRLNEKDIEIVNIDEINSRIKIISTNVIISNSDSIPSWIKNNAGWWRDGYIDDDSFVFGIEFLIDQGLIKLPSIDLVSEKSEIPSWVKENAGWWAEGRISDNDFIYGVNYLVNHGIIEVEM